MIHVLSMRYALFGAQTCSMLRERRRRAPHPFPHGKRFLELKKKFGLSLPAEGHGRLRGHGGGKRRFAIGDANGFRGVVFVDEHHGNRAVRIAEDDVIHSTPETGCG